MCAGKVLGRDEGSVGGLASYPKSYHPEGRGGKDMPSGEVINIMHGDQDHHGECIRYLHHTSTATLNK